MKIATRPFKFKLIIIISEQKIRLLVKYPMINNLNTFALDRIKITITYFSYMKN